MKRLTDTQKTAIQGLRASGLGYGTIAQQLSLSRETVRSYCARNGISPGNQQKKQSQEQNGNEVRIGNTLFIITTGHSKNASETLEKKLEKLILDNAAKSYQFVQG